MKKILALSALFLSVPVFVFAQTASGIPSGSSTMPAFLQHITTQAQFDALTPAQQAEAKAYYAAVSGPSITPSPAMPDSPGVTDCFQYYHFGSVQVDASPTLSSTVPGAILGFSGDIKNNNSYPIVDGQVYAKIFYKTPQTDAAKLHTNGYPVVDEFLVKDNLNLAASSTIPLNFTWQVPTYAQKGDYQIAFFFTSADRFNLLGLTFTDDVVGNTADFAILDGAPAVVAFDKNSVTLNGTPFAFAQPPQHFSATSTVTAKMALVNPSKETKTVSVTTSLYNWDAMLPAHLRGTDTADVTLAPGERKVLSYDVAPTGGAVSYFVVTAKDHDAQSILNIRFVRDGIPETRINFPAVTSYPLAAGRVATLFTCAHSTNLPQVDGNTLTLTLKDMAGNILHTYTYNGPITGAMTGFVDQYTPLKTLASFVLEAKIVRAGQTVDDVSMTYDCRDLDPAACPAAGTRLPNGGTPWWGMGVLALVVSVALGVFLYRRRLKGGQIPNL